MALPSLDVPTYFLAWTTTPWTLPANVALAVAEGARYVVVEGPFSSDGRRERLILAEALVRSHVDALKRKMPAPEAANLGCTHYPLMQETFQDALGPDVKVFSQANLVAHSLSDYLKRHPNMLGTGEAAFLTTGDPKKVSSRATQFLRRPLTFQAA